MNKKKHLFTFTILGTLAFTVTGLVANAGANFLDRLNVYMAARWYKADGFGGGADFNCAWVEDNISFSDGKMSLLLTDATSTSDSGATSYDYSCAQYQTRTTYGYGTFKARVKPAKQAGVVTGFFLYDDTTHDEIDVEFVGNRSREVQFNYFKNGVYDATHEYRYTLPFEPSEDYHNYSFTWSATGITWSVDGTVVHSVAGTSSTLPTTPGKIMANLWTPTATDWAGVLAYVSDVTSRFVFIQYDGGMATITPPSPLTIRP
jgi:beta-glucanase (GH16 family)